MPLPLLWLLAFGIWDLGSGFWVLGFGAGLEAQWGGAWGDGDGEGGFAHEVAVGGSGGSAALGDGPDDQGLAAAVVAGDVDRWFETGEEWLGFSAVVVIAHHAASLVEGDTKFVDEAAAFSALETKGDEDEVGVEGEIGAIGKLTAAVDDFNLLAVKLGDLAVVAFELDGVDGEGAVAQGGAGSFGGKAEGCDFIGGLIAGNRVFAFLMGGGHAVLQWVHRPWGRRRAVLRGAGADIKLGDRFRTLTQGGAEAVGAGIAAANNDNFLALGGNSGVGVVALDRKSVV